MAFKKGTSGNLAGRPKGSQGKSNEDLRAFLLEFLNNNKDKLQDMFDKAEIKDQIRLLSIIFRYTISLPYNPESLTVEQLEQIITYLKNGQKQKELAKRN